MLDHVISIVTSWVKNVFGEYPVEPLPPTLQDILDDDEFLSEVEDGTFEITDIMADGQGFAIRRGEDVNYYRHSQLDDFMSTVTDETILRWLDGGDDDWPNEKGQVANPDYLPYNRKEGF